MPLTADMRILDKENAVYRCMAFPIELLQLRGQCQRKNTFPYGKRKMGVGWGWRGGGGGRMSGCLFSQTAAGNGAVPVCCDRDIGFWFIIHQCFLRGKVQEETCC